MRIKATRKAFKGEEVYSVGYCALANLLRLEEPIAYNSGYYGWSCDYYVVDGAYICTGGRTIGKVVDSAIVKKYENKAKAIMAKFVNYKETKKVLFKLLQKFIKEVRKEK